MPEQAESNESDILHGAEAIAKYLQSKGMRISGAGVYYAAQTNRLALGRLGRDIISSRTTLDRQLEKITAVD
jgi:hypothetical protein